MSSRLKSIVAKNKTVLDLFLRRRKEQGIRTSSQKFIIIARSRTGSTMLINYLKRIPNSYVKKEMMGRKKSILYWKKIPELFFGKNLGYKLIGFKYFYYHPVDDYDANNHIYEYLATHPEVKVIHWMREDLFAVILSRYIAEETDAYAKKKEKIVLTDFMVDEMDFRCELEKSLTQISTVRSLFSNYENYQEFTYEEVVQHGRLSDIFKFLEVNGNGIKHESKTSQQSNKKYNHIQNLEVLRNIYTERVDKENVIKKALGSVKK